MSVALKSQLHVTPVGLSDISVKDLIMLSEVQIAELLGSLYIPVGTSPYEANSSCREAVGRNGAARRARASILPRLAVARRTDDRGRRRALARILCV